MNNPARTLAEFIAALKHADIVCRPAEEDGQELMQPFCPPGRIFEVSEDDYDYWLNVLPPKWIRGGHFCIGEGADCFRLFWFDKQTERYLARQLTWDETVLFCQLAEMPLPT